MFKLSAFFIQFFSRLSKQWVEFNVYNCNPVNISLYAIFPTFPPSSCFNNTFNLFPDVHLNIPTFNCPCKNTCDLKSNPTFLSDCPWLLLTLIVIVNASLTGNCLLWKKSSANGASMILGIQHAALPPLQSWQFINVQPNPQAPPQPPPQIDIQGSREAARQRDERWMQQMRNGWRNASVKNEIAI